eukprot:4406685-Pyramimonas_sp.AAC.1
MSVTTTIWFGVCQVNELTTQNEYKLRLKDLDLNERIKDITEKFTHELEGDKAKFELLLQEKNEQEMEYEEKLKQSEERHQGQMHALEAQFQVQSHSSRRTVAKSRSVAQDRRSATRGRCTRSRRSFRYSRTVAQSRSHKIGGASASCAADSH